MTESRDRWNSSGLSGHLGSQHKIWLWYSGLEAKLKESNHIFSLQHLTDYQLSEWADCDICAWQLQAQLNIFTPVEATLGAASF